MSDTRAARCLRDLSGLIQQLATATGLSAASIQAKIDQLDYRTYQFQNRVLVDPEEFEGLVDHWAAQIKAQLRSAQVADLPARKPNEASEAPDLDPSADLGPLGNVAEVGSLPLPEGYRDRVSHLYGPTLRRIMPQELADQGPFLTAIAHETAAGQQLLNHLSEIIAEKYPGKLSPEVIYSGLQSKAAILLQQQETLPQPPVPEGRRSTSRARNKPASAPAISPLLSSLDLPKGYRRRVSNRYKPTLRSVLPEDAALRSAYLQELVSESDRGKEFLERVADSIKIKYRGKITRQTAYEGLLKTAKELEQEWG
ncbi:hypothetical protein [Lyngbya confervoides]|uniref:Uncharacterized protein n=1 Tax=Lyngbya confervoides BDU141951 TaxID=1574623 RepID=A0ABD4T7M5_9CYAN|nr:hypothetical protein [Lyngbya confervoides]MCM1984774.1 hypothetical protein [Lyngbya confervoides BDU141951]